MKTFQKSFWVNFSLGNKKIKIFACVGVEVYLSESKIAQNNSS